MEIAQNAKQQKQLNTIYFTVKYIQYKDSHYNTQCVTAKNNSH